MPGLRGFSEQNMRRMRQFYEEWADVFENRSTVSSEIEMIPLAVDIQPDTFCSTLLNKLEEQDVFKFLALGFSRHFCIIFQEKDINYRWFFIRKCATEFWKC